MHKHLHTHMNNVHAHALAQTHADKPPVLLKCKAKIVLIATTSTPMHSLQGNHGSGCRGCQAAAPLLGGQPPPLCRVRIELAQRDPN